MTAAAGMVVCIFQGYDGDSPNASTCRKCGKEKDAHYAAELPKVSERQCEYAVPPLNGRAYARCQNLSMRPDFPYCGLHADNFLPLPVHEPETEPEPIADVVNHPTHYAGKGGLECIDVIEAFELDFHLGNAVKYILRAGKKDEVTQELRKAIWYLEREIGLYGEGEGK